VKVSSAMVLILLSQLAGCIEKDMCLDGGGCWDSIDKICRKSEANAQELCDRAKNH